MFFEDFCVPGAVLPAGHLTISMITFFYPWISQDLFFWLKVFFPGILFAAASVSKVESVFLGCCLFRDGRFERGNNEDVSVAADLVSHSRSSRRPYVAQLCSGASSVWVSERRKYQGSWGSGFYSRLGLELAVCLWARDFCSLRVCFFVYKTRGLYWDKGPFNSEILGAWD